MAGPIYPNLRRFYADLGVWIDSRLLTIKVQELFKCMSTSAIWTFTYQLVSSWCTGYAFLANTAASKSFLLGFGWFRKRIRYTVGR